MALAKANRQDRKRVALLQHRVIPREVQSGVIHGHDALRKSTEHAHAFKEKFPNRSAAV